MTDITARKLINSLNSNASTRVEYETSKAAHSCVSKLIKYASLDRTTFKTSLKETFMQKLVDAAALTSFDFINNHVKESQRFNVYAIEKVFKDLHAIARDNVALMNKYNRACVLTCIMNAEKESFAFSRDHAKAMLSKAFNFENVKRSDLATTFNVAESTASTQVSSSFRALEALDVLRFDESARDRCVVSHVNNEHALVKLVRAQIVDKK